MTTKKKPTKGGKPAPMAPQGPRYQQITDDLVVKLKDGTYPIGSMLPTEVELSAAYDVSRYTVREALRQLEGMGLVNRRQRAGTRVAASVPQQRFVQVLPVLLAYAFVSNLSYALVGSLLRHWLAGPVVNGEATGARLLVFNRLMALALVMTSVWMLWSATGLGAKGVS